MMNLKKVIFIVVNVSCCFFLFACQNNNAREFITVFNSENKQILETNNPESIYFFYDLLDEVEDEEIDEDDIIDLPSDAKVNYSYHISRQNEDVTVRFTTYKNYPYVTISNTPAVPEVTVQLDDTNVNSLNHPNSWIR